MMSEEKTSVEELSWGGSETGGRSPSEIYRELGPTALFLRTTTARKAAVLKASKEAKEAEEENARRATEERKRQMQAMLKEATLAGTFQVKPTLPRLQNGKSEWEGFLVRRSVLGLSFDDLLAGNDHCEPPSHDAGRKLVDRIEALNQTFLKSKKLVLSYEMLQKACPQYDSDYRSVLGAMPDKKLRKIIQAFKPQDDLNNVEDNVPRHSQKSDRVLLKRDEIKYSSQLRAITTLFWLAADTDHSNLITKEKYLVLNRKLQIAIMGIYDPGYGRELAERDWELDKDATETLSFETLFCSMFLLTDMYARTVSEDTYCSFLDTIAQRVIRLDKETESALIFRTDGQIISRKTFDYILNQDPKWRAFSLPETPKECRKLYGQSSEQIEDITDFSLIVCRRNPDFEEESSACEEKCRDETKVAESQETTRKHSPLSSELSRGLARRRGKHLSS